MTIRECSNCGYGGLIAYSVKRVASLTSTNQDRLKQLRFERSLRFGSLFRCSVCDGHWYLDADREMVTVITSYALPLVEAWDACQQRLGVEAEVVLNSIGATIHEGYSAQGAMFPCRVETYDGVSFDPAMIILINAPPLPYFPEDFRNKRLVSEISKVSTSKFVLPLDIRNATSNAQELAMGWTPTRLDVGERTYLTHGPRNFANMPQEDLDLIRLSNSPAERTDRFPTLPEKKPVAEFYGDALH